MKIKVNGVTCREKPAGNSKKGDILTGTFDVLDTVVKESGTWYKLEEMKYIQDGPHVIQVEDIVLSEPKVDDTQDFKDIQTGQQMYFIGGRRYSSPDSDLGSNAKAGMVTVLSVNSRSKHPIEVHRSNTVPSLIKGGYIGHVDTSSLRNI